MATTSYTFETMSVGDAAAFNAGDRLLFSSTTLTPDQVIVTNSNNAFDQTIITAGGKSLIFPGSVLADGNTTIAFTSSFVGNSQATLTIGSFAGDDLFLGNHNNSSDGNIGYGFYGNDNIIGSSGADYIFGGAGSDYIDGGSGADHLYGFQLTGGTAADDGADTIHGGAGNDYIQGNAGDDSLFGDAGNDRINGGADNDIIHGGDGNDTVNGNKGDDVIFGDAGNDSLRGGAGNDIIDGGTGNDIILGDLGNDTITGGAGIDVVTGGAGHDTFVFNAGDAIATTGTAPLAGFVDTITDFTVGEDLLNIAGHNTANLVYAQAGISVNTLDAARGYAQTLLDGHSGTDDIAVLNVGSDTYLFYSSASSATIDSVIKLAGVADAHTIDAHAFVAVV